MPVRPARAADVPAVVDVHQESFPGFFLSSLGPRFLRQFYTGLVEIDSGVLLVAIDNDNVVGFVGGSEQQTGFYKKLLRTRFLGFAWAAVPAIIRRPQVALRIMRGITRASEGDGRTSGACLMSIGVNPAATGGGIGQDLVRAFAQEVSRRGATMFSLTTDAHDNERANRFYRRLGMQLDRVVTTHEGRDLNEYVIASMAVEDPQPNPEDA